MSHGIKDLVVLVADKSMKAAIVGLLSRPQAIGINGINYDVFVLSKDNDPGCRSKGHHHLKPMIPDYRHALIIFDRVGCGQEKKSRIELEEDVTANLKNSGWDDRAAAIVIDPELENWVWSDSPHVEECLSWKDKQPTLRNWLIENNLWAEKTPKPLDPKAAMEKALRKVRKPRSSSIYGNIAQRVSLEKCTDASFKKFKETLKNWFPLKK